jgi:uncharacterized flavoprotein (TIGR03862 family)
VEVDGQYRRLVNTAAPDRHLVVVGAGPAGLMAAEVAASAGVRVTVLEQMPSAGRKLLMAGRGGLNLTHSEDLERFLSRYGPARAALEPALRDFPPSALVAWAEGLGQSTFIGTSGRIFPKAMKASPLLRAWLARLDSLGVRVRTRHRLVGRTPDGTLDVEGPDGARLTMPADAMVLALGGASWPRLGSDGFWTRLLSAAGIDVQPLEPANCGVTIAWSPALADRHAGAPLKRIAMTCAGETHRGEAIITRQGLEGGVVYALSRAIRETLHRDGSAHLTIDLRPDLTIDALAGRLASARKGDSRSNMLRKAAQLSPSAIALLREAGGTEVPAEPQALATRIKSLPLTITGLADITHAISSAGGLAWHELDTHFMVKKMPGVFAAGEMIDWDAPTGGYLLQACMASGRAAGRGAVNYIGAGLSAGAPRDQ